MKLGDSNPEKQPSPQPETRRTPPIDVLQHEVAEAVQSRKRSREKEEIEAEGPKPIEAEGPKSKKPKLEKEDYDRLVDLVWLAAEQSTADTSSTKRSLEDAGSSEPKRPKFEPEQLISQLKDEDYQRLGLSTNKDIGKSINELIRFIETGNIQNKEEAVKMLKGAGHYIVTEIRSEVLNYPKETMKALAKSNNRIKKTSIIILENVMKAKKKKNEQEEALQAALSYKGTESR